jgi:DNA-directed RNA polymerase specialized sigma54-like protein
MADDVKAQARLASQLVMTPQLQLAIRMLSTPSGELAALIAPTPGLAIEPSDPDPLLASVEVDGEPAWQFAGVPTEITADVWLDGNPPRALANRRALPAVRIVEATRDAQWIVRSLVQRARTFERVVGALARLRPQLGVAMSADEIAPVETRELAAAIGMHESTLERVAKACTVQNKHRVFALAAGRTGISVA